MKYLNGNWLVKDGFSIDYGQCIYDSRIEDNKLTLWVPFKEITDPGMTLDDGMITLEISSPRENIINTKIINYRGSVDHGPNFKLSQNQNISPEIKETVDKFIFKSGKTKLEISKGSQILFHYFYENELKAEVAARSIARIFDPDGKVHMSNSFVLEPGEKIYGLGERFSNFVKNGQEIEMWNADGGTETMQSYKNIPLYLSNRKYGIFVDSSEKVSYEIASQQVDRVEFSVPDQTLSYYFIGGSDNKEVLDHYTALTGRPPLLPAWSYGLWLTTSFTTKYDEHTVMSFINGMIERKIPLSVFHFDCCWMKPTEWCNFEWDPDIFPDPEELLEKIHDKGIKICVWINPYIAQKSRLFDEGMKNGYFIKKTNGDVWQWDKWQAGMAIVDFTNPDAVSWYQGYLKELLRQGVDVFKTDFGERIPSKGVKFFDGSDPKKMHNYYTLLYNKVVTEAIADLYRRWTQFGLLSSHSRYHGSTTYKVPWLYGEKSVENTKKYTNLKLKLLPYLMAMSNEAHYHGTPILRSMVLEFPDDPGCEDLDMQYMLGSNLLVAPIFNDQGLATFYVPEDEGKWISILTGKAYEGGRWYKEKFDDFTLPLLARPNSVIITGRYNDETMCDYTDHPIVNVYEMKDGKISTIITDNYGEKLGTIVVEKNDGKIKAYSDVVKNFDLIIHDAGKEDQKLSTNDGQIKN